MVHEGELEDQVAAVQVPSGYRVVLGGRVGEVRAHVHQVCDRRDVRAEHHCLEVEQREADERVLRAADEHEHFGAGRDDQQLLVRRAVCGQAGVALEHQLLLEVQHAPGYHAFPHEQSLGGQEEPQLHRREVHDFEVQHRFFHGQQFGFEHYTNKKPPALPTSCPKVRTDYTPLQR